MAVRVSIADGNFTTAGTWAPSDGGTNSVLVSSSASVTALTTGNLDSATFTPANNAVDGLMIRLGARASGSPSNTMTITLRNNTTPGTRELTWTLNVSDLPACDTTSDQGGWILLRAAASVTPNGTDTYVVRATLSATTTAVSLSTNGTANNWQRILVRATTGAPAASDDLQIARTYSNSTNPCTVTNRAVTMDNTATTIWGAGTTGSYRTAALNVSNGASLTFGTAASTNYYFKINGWVTVYSGGSITIGDATGTSIPSTSTAVWEHVEASDGQMRFTVQNGGTVKMGWDPGTRAVSQTYATANITGGGTSITTAVSTGWKSGDSIGIGVVHRTLTQVESVALTVDASGTTLTTGAITNARTVDATNLMYPEVVLRTRGVIFRTATSTNAAAISLGNGATFRADWVSFTNCGSSTIDGFTFAGPTGTLTLNHVIFDSPESSCVFLNSSNSTLTGTITLNDVVVYGLGGSDGIKIEAPPLQANKSLFSITDVTMIATTACQGFNLVAGGGDSLAGITWGGSFRLCGCNAFFDITGTRNPYAFTLDSWTVHGSAGGNSNGGLALARGSAHAFTVSNGNFYRNNSVGVTFTGTQYSDVVFSSCRFVGNQLAGISLGATVNQAVVADSRFLDCVLSGDTSFAQADGVLFAGDLLNVTFENCTLGVVSGINVAHTTADFVVQSPFSISQMMKVTLINTNTASTTEVSNPGSALTDGSYRAYQAVDQVAATHKVVTAYRGTVAYSTSGADVSPCVQLTPASATLKLDTAAGLLGRGWLIPVLSGATKTISVKVSEDGSYNGNAARLILRRNSALGVTADTVLGTTAGTPGSGYATVTGTTPTATDDGIFEVVVDCDGTAGNVYVDTLTVS